MQVSLKKIGFVNVTVKRPLIFGNNVFFIFYTFTIHTIVETVLSFKINQSTSSQNKLKQLPIHNSQSHLSP